MNLLAICCIIVLTTCSFVLIIAAIKVFSDVSSVTKERQQQAELKAHSDEICRLAHRLRRIEDKLGIKEGEEDNERIHA